MKLMRPVPLPCTNTALKTKSPVISCKPPRGTGTAVQRVKHISINAEEMLAMAVTATPARTDKQPGGWQILSHSSQKDYGGSRQLYAYIHDIYVYTHMHIYIYIYIYIYIHGFHPWFPYGFRGPTKSSGARERSWPRKSLHFLYLSLYFLNILLQYLISLTSS